MLGSTNYPPLPQARRDTLYAFYPYPLRARERVHASLRRSAPSTSTLTSPSSPSSSSSSAADTSAAVGRAARRALRGKRPVGVALGKDAADLSDEEAALDDEKHAINAFGHRFLLPFGRRLTQMEMEAAPSPTPSDHDHRQEDRNAEPPSPIPPSPELGEQEGGEVDLDASLEDRDADHDQSTEYDSDDLRLMRNMDRSIGTHTPESDDRYHEEETMEEE
ncbi:uncharacterized protein LOC62_06G008509 [Vanrija pseudolonga]|uniref:Uncharacterized protein n=1 Tax=Vanrija pseudolonga TaxID=143232 RepID=A0AAF1BQM4_9TREE|nr:hypothetical protein LOC62_06G008509 [Vanrija pseudolonga]